MCVYVWRCVTVGGGHFKCESQDQLALKLRAECCCLFNISYLLTQHFLKEVGDCTTITGVGIGVESTEVDGDFKMAPAACPVESHSLEVLRSQIVF